MNVITLPKKQLEVKDTMNVLKKSKKHYFWEIMKLKTISILLNQEERKNLKKDLFKNNTTL
jgi:hypothetical protein